jgi:hypothetical protein
MYTPCVHMYMRTDNCFVLQPIDSCIWVAACQKTAPQNLGTFFTLFYPFFPKTGYIKLEKRLKTDHFTTVLPPHSVNLPILMHRWIDLIIPYSTMSKVSDLFG